jgi:hypothetical protein
MCHTYVRAINASQPFEQESWIIGSRHFHRYKWLFPEDQPGHQVAAACQAVQLWIEKEALHLIRACCGSYSQLRQRADTIST